MSRFRMVGVALTGALFASTLSLAAPVPTAAAAEPVDSIDLLLPHALDDRTAEDGTPIALAIGDRVVGARPSTTPRVADLDAPVSGTRHFFDCQAAAGGDGTQDAPFNTLAAAANLTLGPGDQVLLRAGTVCEGQLRLTGSGTDGDRIVVDAYGDPSDGRPVLNGNGVESVVRIDQGEHWEVRNLEITNQTGDARDYTTPRRGIVVALTDYGRGQDYVIADNHIHHVWGQNRKDLGGSGGIQFEAYAGTQRIPTAFDGIVVRHNVVQDVNRSGINVGSNFRTRPSVGSSINDNPFYAWGGMHIHDNIVSNIGGDGIVNQFAEGSLIENNTVWDASNHHGGRADNGNNAAVWSWDSDYVTFRANHVFATKMPAGTWDGTAFDADYGTAGTVFEYNVTHDNEGGFMLFCGCGGLSTDTIMRYNISLNDGKGGEHHAQGPRLFFNAGQSDGEVHNNTFLLYPGVQLNKSASGGTAVLFANNVLLAQGDVVSASARAEVWRSNVFAGTWNSWPGQGNGNQLVPGLGLADGTGFARLQVATESVIGTGVPVYSPISEGLGYWDEPHGVDVAGEPVPVHLAPDAGAFQLTDFDPAADVAVVDGGFENATATAWVLDGASVGSGRDGGAGLALTAGSASQEFTAGANRTYRVTAAVQGDVEVTVTATRPEGDSRASVVAALGQTADLGNGWRAVSTVVRTASTANTLVVAATGTGTLDDVSVEVEADYVVDGSFESPDNSPWGGTRSTSESSSGQYAANLGAKASYENNEVVVPDPGSYELWGWAKTPAGASMTLGAKNTGVAQVTLGITGQEWTQGMRDISTSQNRFTAFCYSGSATVAGMFCDDVSVTPVWDGAAPSVPATPAHVVPDAPADPPAPPRPQPVEGYLPFDQTRVAGVSSENSDGVADNVLSDGTGAIWHTRWDPSVAAPPHWITLEVLTGHELTALAYTPRGDNSWNGVAKDWRILGSADAEFGSPTMLASGTWAQSRTEKVAEFFNPTGLRFVRLHIDSHYGDSPEDQFGTAAVIKLRGYETAPTVSVRPDGGATSATAGGGITVDFSGFRPATRATVELTGSAGTVQLGTVMVDDTRAGSAPFTIPAETQAGEWTLAISQSADAEYALPELTATAGLTVLAAPVEPSPDPSPTPSVTATPTPTPTTAPTTAVPEARDLYSTPGFHAVNGRHWYTRCEPYSQTTRCFTDIWGTSVAQVDGRWVQSNGWVFNNLTYLPSPRELWAGNPLGNTGEWTAADGARWRTECDTALTGRGGCRSFIWGPAIAASQTAQGTTFRVVDQWRFNNMVRFS